MEPCVVGGWQMFVAGVAFAIGCAALTTLVIWIAAEGMDGDARTGR